MRAMTEWKPWAVGQLDQLGEQHPADARPRWSRVDVHRVLDRGAVGGPVAVRRQRAEADDLAVVVHRHDRRVGARRSCEPGPLLVEGAGHQVEGDGRRRDLDVVDRPDGLGVGELGQSELHGRHRIGRLPPSTAGGFPRARAATIGFGRPTGGGYDGPVDRRPLGAAPASLAQSAERFHGKEKVVGSIPTGGSSPAVGPNVAA